MAGMTRRVTTHPRAFARPSRDSTGTMLIAMDRLSTGARRKPSRRSQLITVTATGHKPETGSPSITVSDAGEGQEPDLQPDTFMSINRSNELRIRCVRASTHGWPRGSEFSDVTLQPSSSLSHVGTPAPPSWRLIRAKQWGFTIGATRATSLNQNIASFTYLAPVGATTRDGGLAFDADDGRSSPLTTPLVTMPIPGWPNTGRWRS